MKIDELKSQLKVDSVLHEEVLKFLNASEMSKMDGKGTNEIDSKTSNDLVRVFSHSSAIIENKTVPKHFQSLLFRNELVNILIGLNNRGFAAITVIRNDYQPP